MHHPLSALPIWCLADLREEVILGEPPWSSPSKCLWCQFREDEGYEDEPTVDLLEELAWDKALSEIWAKYAALQRDAFLCLHSSDLASASVLLEESRQLARLYGWHTQEYDNVYYLCMIHIFDGEYFEAELKIEYLEDMQMFHDDVRLTQSNVILKTLLWLFTDGKFGSCPAREVFDQMCNRSFQSSKILLVRALVMLQEGDKQSAARNFQKASNFAAGHGILTQACVYSFFAAWSFQQSGDCARAKALYTDLLKRESELQDLLFKEMIRREASLAGVTTPGITQ